MKLNEDFKIVECTEEYWEFVRILRLDNRVSYAFIQTNIIDTEQQKIYMNTYHNCYRIALVNGKAAGFVGVINDDIRICTHPDYQRKGLAQFMIKECMKIWPNAFAKVKIDNEASIRLFEKCGFSKKFFILTKD